MIAGLCRLNRSSLDGQVQKGCTSGEGTACAEAQRHEMPQGRASIGDSSGWI